MKNLCESAPSRCACAVVAVLALASARASAADLLLHPCNSTDGWKLNLGAEFAGARGELSTEPVDGRSVLKVGCDLSRGGRYVGAHFLTGLARGDALVFSIRSHGFGYFIARVRDATDQEHDTGFHVKGAGWRTVVLPLTKKQFARHWSGARDGPIHWPLKRILIAASSSKPGAGAFWLRDLAVRTTRPTRTWRIDVSTDQPGHIHFPDGAKVVVTAAVQNRLRGTREARVLVRVTSLEGRTVAEKTAPMSFGPWERATVSLPVDAPGRGCFHVAAAVNCGDRQERAEGAFGVAPRPLCFGQRDPESFFGLHVSDPAVAARIGVHWSRRFNMWRYQEYRRGVYTHMTDHVKACADAGIDTMMCLDYREPHWLKPKTTSEGLPTDEGLRRYAAFARAAVRAHREVAVFEIQNEPDLELCAQRNISVETGVEFYTRIVKALAPIIRAEAPKARIAGCSVSGVDYRHGFRYSRPVLERVGGLLDIFAAHPYASPRTFGDGLRPLFPEANREADKHRAALKLLADIGRGHKMWIGEKGWEIKDSASLCGPHALAFANCCARSLVIARAAGGVGKYFWFLQEQPYRVGGKYVLFRGQPVRQPMPAAVAYANVAYQLDRAKPVESLAKGGGSVQAHVFERELTGTAVAVLWSVDHAFALAARWPEGTTATDLYGRPFSTEAVRVTGSPVFLRCERRHAAALVGAIKGGTCTPAEPVAFRGAGLVDVNTVRVGLGNRSEQALDVTARVGEQSKAIRLPVGGETVWTAIRLARPATEQQGRPLALALDGAKTDRRSVAIPTALTAVARRGAIHVDGKTEDWAGVRLLAVEKQESILPPDPAGWSGKADLSLRVGLAWDDRALYVLVRVTDDRHVTPNVRANGFWASDSIQLAVDVMNDAWADAVFNADDREYGMVVGPNGARAFQTFPRHARVRFEAAGRRDEGETVYELALPWKALGREPKAGAVFSLNVIANENDGHGRKYWMGLTAGIGEGKRPGKYRDFYLATQDK